ncbi:MAG: cytochrome C oxidase subunit II [Alphaproteobacteria bacterium]|nr:cytochrome C oxidase subunit II [Alphaproteobacteria bacterium]
MALTPPSERLWWNEPIHKSELVWVTVAFLWGLVMFFTMIFWHVYGQQNLSNEAYRIEPARFEQKVEAMVAKYKIGEEGSSGIPVVKPPAGSDVYMLGRTFQWYPVLELEKGKNYRLHLSSLDVQHGFSLQPTNINLQIHPHYEMVITVTPTETGDFGVICNEFCGIGHHQMLGKIRVK